MFFDEGVRGSEGATYDVQMVDFGAVEEGESFVQVCLLPCAKDNHVMYVGALFE